MSRSDALQVFLDSVFVAFDLFAHDLRARQSIAHIFSNLSVPQPDRAGISKRLPVCDRHLEDAVTPKTDEPVLVRLLEQFKALEPVLEWKCRSTHDGSASENFPMGHANTMIVGPDGLEDRGDVWLGATLLAPNVRYPDHDHPPEETYLVLSDSEFRQGDSEWFSPGVGGSFYNPPGIKHAMRSGEKPLFAFWALRPDRTGH